MIQNNHQSLLHAFVNNQETIAQIKIFNLQNNYSNDNITLCNIKEALYHINKNQAKIYLLEFDQTITNVDPYQMFAARAKAMGGKILLICDPQKAPDFNWLKAAEIDLLINTPIDTKQLKQKITELITQQNAQQHNNQSNIIAVTKLKPSSGASICVTSIAAILATQGKTLIIDLDTFFSKINNYFQTSPNNHLTEILASPSRVDVDLINSSSKLITDNLYLLAANNLFNPTLEVTEQAIDKLISTCNQSYNYIIINLPFSNKIHNNQCLFLADFILNIVNLDMQNKVALQQFQELTRNSFLQEKTKFVINHISKYSHEFYDDFCDGLDIEFAAEINYDPDLIRESQEECTAPTIFDNGAKFSQAFYKLLINMKLVPEQNSNILSKLKQMLNFI